MGVEDQVKATAGCSLNSRAWKIAEERFKLNEHLRPTSSVLDVHIEHDEPRRQVDTYSRSGLKQMLRKFPRREWRRALPSRRSRPSIRTNRERGEARCREHVGQFPIAGGSACRPIHARTQLGVRLGVNPSGNDESPHKLARVCEAIRVGLTVSCPLT